MFILVHRWLGRRYISIWYISKSREWKVSYWAFKYMSQPLLTNCVPGCPDVSCRVSRVSRALPRCPRLSQFVSGFLGTVSRWSDYVEDLSATLCPCVVPHWSFWSCWSTWGSQHLLWPPQHLLLPLQPHLQILQLLILLLATIFYLLALCRHLNPEDIS